MNRRWTMSDLWCQLRQAWGGVPHEARQDSVRELLTPERARDALGGLTVQDYRETLRTDRDKRGRRKGTRAWADVTGICLHQTASPVGHDHPRILSVPAHAHVSQEGVITLLQPVTAYMHHGHALNSFTIGIELEARAAGTEGDPSTFWRSRKEKAAGKQYGQLVREATDVQLDSLDVLISHYIEQKSEHGGPELGLYAHRQGHKSRTSDPGSRIAQHVCRQWMSEDNSYLNDTTRESYGSGRPWPEGWRA